MSSSDYREPTNDELWAQPPSAPQAPPTGHGLAPLPPVPPPAHLAHAQSPATQQRPDRTVFVLAIISMALGIPLTAISMSLGGLPGLLVVWVAIVAVTFVYARSRKQ